MHKSIVYYTDHALPPALYAVCRDRLMRAAPDIEIVTVGLNKECDFGHPRFILSFERGILAMHKQILTGLQLARGDVVFLCEHDVYYHPSHFTYTPLHSDTFCYNVSVLHVRWPDGYAVAWDDCQQVSGLCASRELLIGYYSQRIAQIERDSSTGSLFNRHYEPGLKQTVGGQRVENWKSEQPNLDIRHGGNLTPSKWSPADFRNQKYSVGWREMMKAPDWDAITTGGALAVEPW